MSKTTRRMNRDGMSSCWLKENDTILIRRGEMFDDTEEVFDDCYYGKRYANVRLAGKLYTKKLALYHNDNINTMRNAPKWYRQNLNRKLRTKQKKHLHNCFLDDDFDNYAEPAFIRDAAWYW